MAKGNTIGSVFVRVRPRVVNFRREVDDKLRDEFSKPIELNVQAVLDTSKLDKDMNKALRNAGKKAKLFFDADFDGVDKAIKTLERKLKDLQRDELEFTANTKGLEKALDELEQRKRDMSKVTVEYTNDEAGYKKVLDQIRRIQASKPTITTTFKADAESLDAAEAFARRKLREAKLKAPIEFTYTDDYAGRKSFMEHLEQIKSERHKVHFIAQMDDSQIDSKIRALRDQNVAVRAKFDLASAAAVEGQLAALSRDRWVDLKPRLSKRAMATLQGSFMAIAGINSIGHLIRQIEHIALNFDDMAVAGAAAGAAVGSLVSVGTVGLGALLSVAGDTLQVFQGLAMAPALLLSGATALQTWTAVWNNFGDAIEGDADALARIPENGKKAVGAIQELDKAVNRTVQNNFWGEMTDEVERFTENIGPHITKAMGQTATVMGKTVSAMLDHTETLAKNGSLEKFTKNNTKFMELLGESADVAFKSLMEMGIQGSRYLPALGGWVRDLSRDFAGFISEATRTGKFDRWIQNSIKSIQSLGRFSKGTWDMLAGITRAFENVGGAGLHEMADGMERIGRWANSSGTQAKMEGIFRAAMDGAASAGRGFSDLMKTIWDMDDALNSLLRQTGQLAGDFMTQISKIDFSVAVRGVTDLMDGMIDFVNMAGPGFESIANIFGRLSSIGGEVAREIAHGLNLTMGAIDGFIARVEGPLINAIHPLTRVFEDIAALGTPILFALADSVGVLLNAFAALPAPIQNVITLLAIMGRTGFGTAISKTVGHFSTMRTGVLRQMQMMATQIPGYFNTAAGSVERRAMIMSTRVQAQMATMRSGLKRAFGAGGLLGALGGGWGLAIAGAVAALSAFAGATAQAKAHQQQLVGTLDQVTGAMTRQSEVALYDALMREAEGFREKMRAMDVDFNDAYKRMGFSVSDLTDVLKGSREEVEAYADGLQELEDLDMRGIQALKDGDFSGVSEAARQVYEHLGLANLKGTEFNHVVSRINGEFGPMADGMGMIRDRTGELGHEADEAAEAVGRMSDRADGLPAGVQEAADAMGVLADATSTAEQRVEALDQAMRILAGDELGIDEMISRATQSMHDGMNGIESLAAEGGWDVSRAFSESGEWDLRQIEAIDVGGPMGDLRKGVLGELDVLRQQFDDNLIDEDAYKKGLSSLQTDWEGTLQAVADKLNMTEAQSEAFFAHFNSLSFDPKELELIYDGDASGEAQRDWEILDALGMRINESDYIAEINADGDKFITETERVEGAADRVNQLVAEGKIDANAENFDAVLQAAMEMGLVFDGKEFIPALDADGKPAEGAIAAAEALGYAFSGQEFVAVADVKTDAVTDSLANTLNTVEGLWVGEKFISILDSDGQPTEEAVAYAESLGMAWHNGEFVAVIDANGENADAEITAAREHAVQFEGVYQALLDAQVLPSQAIAVAEAIAGNEAFEGDYTAFLDALRTEEGKAAVIDAINSLEGIDDQVKTDIIALFTGKPIVEEAKSDHVELDNTSVETNVGVNYDDTGAEAAKSDKREIQDHPALSIVDSEYNSEEANAAKNDSNEINSLVTGLEVGSEYTGDGSADAKADAQEINSTEATFKITAEYEGTAAADAKQDAAEIDETRARYKIDTQYSGNGAQEAKDDAAEIDGLTPSFDIGSEYSGTGAQEAKDDAAAIDGLTPSFDISSEYSSTGADDAKSDASAIDGLSAQWSITADASGSNHAVSSVRSQIAMLSGMVASPSIRVVGAEAARGLIQTAVNALNQFRASSAVATISLAGAAAVVGQATAARNALMQAQGTYVTRLTTAGGPQVVAMSRQALAANERVDDTFTTRLRTVGGPQVISMALRTYQAADRVEDVYTAMFREVGASQVIGQAFAIRAAINSIDKNPTITFGGRVSSSLNAAASRVRAAAASARAAAALSADGSLSNSRFKPEVKYFGNGGINFMDKPTRAHIAPAGQYVMYAEKETGGEAFIPLAASKRDRSVAIWKETGKRLNAFEDGDIVGGSGAGFHGDNIVINMLEGKVTAGDIMNEITHRRRRKGR